MLIFRAIKRSLTFLHIYPPQSFDNFNRFNFKNVMIVVFLIIATILTGMFFVLEAETFDDYSSAIHSGSTAGLGAFIISVTIIKTSQVYRLCGIIEELIQQCELAYYLFLENILFIEYFLVFATGSGPDNFSKNSK